MAIVAVVALLISLIHVLGSRLWVTPDASYYVTLAGGIADRGDFSNELFLIRPVGYPLFLAGVFRLFGPLSPDAIQVSQHLMVVGICVLAALIGWELTRRRSVALLTGLFVSLSLQLLTFANLIFAEVPYALALTACVYALVRFHRSGSLRCLAAASALAGIASLLRPTGLALVPVCVCVALWRTLRIRRADPSIGRSPWALSAMVRRYFAPRSRMECRSVARAEARGSELENEERPNRVATVRERNESRAATVRERFSSLKTSRFPRLFRITAVSVCALLPALVFIVPPEWHNRRVHGGDAVSRCRNLALYHRIFRMDGLDAPQSDALADIRQTVEEARRRGFLRPDDDIRLWGTVVKAYRTVRGWSLAQAAGVMGDAARDALDAHRKEVLLNTIRYAYWMLASTDTFYRFHPGGAPGLTRPNGERVRATGAELFDIATYRPMLDEWLQPYRHYLPLRIDPRPLTPLWRAVARVFHRYADQPPSPVRIGDTLYEVFTWICLLGLALASAIGPRRGAWILIIGGVLATQVFGSALYAGPTPRYAVPV
ncbi:MAG: phospholipid carrier-dependent glycosyltransferase, partial [Planctomycetota bacterium]